MSYKTETLGCPKPNTFNLKLMLQTVDQKA